MRLLMVSATTYEMAPLLHFLEKNAVQHSFFNFEYHQHTIHPLVTGVGMVNCAMALARSEFIKEVDMAIQMGVAGSFNPDLPLGSVVEVVSDRFADLGVEEADGSFTDVYEMDLCEKDGFPFENGWLRPGKRMMESGLKEVSAITVNKVHGHTDSIEKIKHKYSADIETMEGASFFYGCRLLDVRCMQIRAISNRVEPRNRAAWELATAIDHLNEEVIQLIQQITQ